MTDTTSDFRSLPVSYEAEDLSARLPGLLVEAERISNTVAYGIHGRRRAGLGETFWQFRRYMPGDSAHEIDWRQSAKSQSHFVRENEWEAAESIWIWTDTSPSMDYRHGTNTPTKMDRALVLTLALAHLLLRGGERVGVLGQPMPPVLGVKSFDRLGLTLLQAPKGLSELNETINVPRHARVVAVSDFLDDFAAVEKSLGGLPNRGIRGHLVQVLDPSEEDFPFNGRTRFEGLEEKLELVIGKAEALKNPYQEQLGSLQSELSHWTKRRGWTFAQHRTDRAPHTALLALFNVLADAPLDTRTSAYG